MKPEPAMRIRCLSRSREATTGLGEALAAVLEAGDVVAMDGDLGAGKTAMTEGIARGLGVAGPVSSPTFTLLIEHAAGPRGLPLYHFDAYRLTGAAEFLSLGFDEILDGGVGVSVVEWAENVREALPASAVRVTAERGDASAAGDDDARRIDVVFPCGEKRAADFYRYLEGLAGLAGLEGLERLEAGPC